MCTWKSALQHLQPVYCSQDACNTLCSCCNQFGHELWCFVWTSQVFGTLAGYICENYCPSGRVRSHNVSKMNDISRHEDRERHSNTISTVSAKNMYDLAWFSPQALKKSLVLTCLKFVERETYNFSSRNRPCSFSGGKSDIFTCLEMRMLQEKCIQPDLHASQHLLTVTLVGNTRRSMSKSLLPHLDALLHSVLHLFYWALLLVPFPVQAMTPRHISHICTATFPVHDT